MLTYSDTPKVQNYLSDCDKCNTFVTVKVYFEVMHFMQRDLWLCHDYKTDKRNLNLC